MAILTIIFLIVYTYGLFGWNKKVDWRLNPLASRTVKYLHYLTALVSLTVLFFYTQFDIGLRGLWTTRIFIIVALLTGIFFIFFSEKTVYNKLEKIYFKIFSFLPVVAISVFLFIPFIGAVIVGSLIGQLISPADKIYYQDKDIRIQSSFVGLLVAPRIDIFEKKYIFEKHIYSADFFGYDPDSLKVYYDKDSTRIILYNSSEYQEKTKTICIDKVK